MKLFRLFAVMGFQSVVAVSAWAHSHASHEQGGHGAASQEMAGMVQQMPVAENVTATECWLRLLPGSAPSAGYFLLRNNRAEEIAVVSAVSNAFDEVMVHQTRHENGLSRMAMVSEVRIAAGEQLEFKPGSYHLMLEKANRPVQVGDTVEMSILLKSKEKVVAECEVKPAGTLPSSGGMSH